MANSEASAYIGGAPMTDEFKDILNRQTSGMPPAGTVDVTARFNGEAITIPVSVARNALYKRMDELNRKLSSTDNIPNPYQFAGNGNPYLSDMVRHHELMTEMATAEIERARAELDRLGKLTDAELIEWAVTNRHIARHVSGGWMAV